MHKNFLTDQDLEELTGYIQPNKQARSLREHGISYVLRRDGKIRVTWDSVSHPSKKSADLTEEPNWEAIA